MSKFQNNKEVYVIRNSQIIKCTIKHFVPKESSTGKPVYVVDPINNDCCKFAIIEEYIFSTEEEAKIGLEKHISNEIEEYKSKIKTVQDLIEFALSLEFEDKFAKQAYKQKAKELLGIEIKNTWY